MRTQHDNEGDIFASLAAGASGYCLKDVGLSAFIQLFGR